MKVSELTAYLPHRPPAIWIDEVGHVDDTRGESFVDLHATATYMTGSRLRESALIEFIAQSYGYQQAAKAKRAGTEPKTSLKAFLVSVTKCHLKETTSLKVGDRLTISTHDITAVGPITLFNATVTAAGGIEYARASLKVYSQTT